MTEGTSVRAGCDACAKSVTAVVVGDMIPAEVAEFFRAHAAHGVSPATGRHHREGRVRRPRFLRG